MLDAATWADLLDNRQPALCRVCGSIALPTRTWIRVPPTRGMVMYKTGYAIADCVTRT